MENGWLLESGYLKIFMDLWGMVLSNCRPNEQYDIGDSGHLHHLNSRNGAHIHGSKVSFQPKIQKSFGGRFQAANAMLRGSTLINF